MRTAIILGATGLVGSQLLQLLLDNFYFEQVVILVRRSTGIKDPKLVEHIIDFDRPEQWHHLVKGDVLFSAFGTTLKTAGSKEAQYKIDYTYQYHVAKAAAENGVPIYILISAAYVSPDSSIFYNRMKGELERDVKQLPFRSIHIIQPGMLAGDRKELRVGEKIFTPVIHLVSLIPGLGKYKPIHDKTVARAMMNAALKQDKGVHTYTLGGVFRLAEEKLF